MSDYDAWKLSNPDDDQRWPEEDARYGLCEFCESPLDCDDEGEFCIVCEPRCDLGLTPVRSSFAVNDGRVTVFGWSL